MKYIVVIGDGMADYPVAELGHKTPLQCAHKPSMDAMARRGRVGLVKTVPAGMAPGSDTANLSVLGYDPRKYSSGRSSFEAASMGVILQPGTVSYRCNLVTLSPGGPYEGRTMVDYCAGEISSAEARQLIDAVSRHFAAESTRFYPGVSYRHLLVVSGTGAGCPLTPPHDISGRRIGEHLPAGGRGAALRAMMEESASFLPRHPVNEKRLAAGLNPANSIWLWGEGRPPALPAFFDRYGLNGAAVSAVDLVKGIAVSAGLTPLHVEGATGNIDTDYAGKVAAALGALRQGCDFVFIHIEAPDECSHRYEVENKVKAIELIDREVVKALQDELEGAGVPYGMLVMPDHATPLSLRTHAADPVPFVIYRSDRPERHSRTYDEAAAGRSGFYLAEGHRLMEIFLDTGSSCS